MKGGFKSKRIFCNQYIKRKSRFCYAKGYPTDSFDDQGRQVMKCAFHGGQNTDYFGYKHRAGKGFITGLWAQKFDNMATVTNFVIVPLSFLSGTFYPKQASIDEPSNANMRIIKIL